MCVGSSFCPSLEMDNVINDANSAASSSSPRESVKKLQEELKVLRQELKASLKLVNSQHAEINEHCGTFLYMDRDKTSLSTKHIIECQIKKQKEILHLIGQKDREIAVLKQAINASNPNYAIEQAKKAEAEEKNAESWEMHMQSVEAGKKADELLRSASTLKRILESLQYIPLIEYETKAFAASVQFKREEITEIQFKSILKELSEAYIQESYTAEYFTCASLEELQKSLEDVQREYNALPKTPSEINLMQLQIDKQEKEAKELKDEAKRLQSLYLDLRQYPDIVQELVNRSA